MIPGIKEIKIKKYFPRDHGDEIYGAVVPAEGEEIVGIPYQWHTDLSFPYIAHRVNGKTIKTVNILDVSEIIF